MNDKKPVLVTIDNVRIIQNDELNVAVERLEIVVNPKSKQTNQRWRFKGYSSSILGALRLIVIKELLVDKTSINNLENYIKQVDQSIEKVLGVIE